MCFYTRTDYVCGDWKWGNMKEQCPRENRIGETCGARLSHIDSNMTSPQICRTCTEITTKRRRLVKAQADLNRYTEERKLPGLAAAKQQEVEEFEQAIARLNAQRTSSKHLHSRNFMGRNRDHLPGQSHRSLPSSISDLQDPITQRQDVRHRYRTYGRASEPFPFALRA